MRINFLLPLIIIICFTLDTNAQPIEYASKYGFLDFMKIDYRCPDGFNENFSSHDFLAHDSAGGYLGVTCYQIESVKDDIAIVFNSVRIMSKEDSIKLFTRIKALDPNPLPPLRNTSYIQRMKLKADFTYSLFKPKIFTRKYSVSKFNADYAGIYQLRQTHSYLDKYDKCRVVYMQKNDRAIVELFYFYNNSSASKVENYIKKTEGMIRFKD